MLAEMAPSSSQARRMPEERPSSSEHGRTNDAPESSQGARDATAPQNKQASRSDARPRSFFGVWSGRSSPVPSVQGTSPPARSALAPSDARESNQPQNRVPSKQIRRTPSLLSMTPSTRSITGLSTLSPITRGVTSNDDEEHLNGQRGNGVGTSANITSQGSTYATLAVPSHGASADGAMGRLKKIASNASMRKETHNTPLASNLGPPANSGNQGQVKGEIASQRTEQVPVKAATYRDESSAQPGDGDEAAPQATGDNGDASTSSLTKRRANELDVVSSTKQSRRRTWFGVKATPDPDLSAATEHAIASSSATQTDEHARKASSSEHEDAVMQPAEASLAETRAPQKDPGKPPGTTDVGTSSYWLPWRGPSAAAPPGDSQRGEDPTSYSDTVWRYVSWSSAAADGERSHPGHDSTTPRQADSRGWFTWRGAAPVGNSSGQEAPILQTIGETAKTSAVKPQPDAEENQAPKATGKDPGASEAIPQASFAAKWIPYWSSSQPVTHTQDSVAPQNSVQGHEASPQKHTAMAVETTTMTPAEVYKAESLARLGAKDAVINRATRGAWINYFGNRRTAAPPARMQDSVDEPEVMKLDLEAKDKQSRNDSTDSKLVKRLQPKALSQGVRSSNSSVADGQKSTDKGEAPAPKVATGKMQKGTAGRENPRTSIADPAPPMSRPMTPLTSDKNAISSVVTREASKDGALLEHKTSNVSTAAAKKPMTLIPARPNLLLPSFDDSFSREPRSLRPRQGVIEKTLSYLFSDQGKLSPSTKGKDDERLDEAQFNLPRHYDVLGHRDLAVSRGCKRIDKVTVIGVHGWFSTGPLRNIFGEPTGTSVKFSTMMRNEVSRHFQEAGHPLKEEQIISIALEADGKVSERVDKSFSRLISNPKWVNDILSSGAIFVAAHSQGSIVATHLLARLIEQRHIDAKRTKVALLCMCGIHSGPFHHLRGSMTGYYMNTFETPAARELFDFQNRLSPVSQLYAASLRIIVAAGVKLLYVASLDDQVVPLYSALHTSASHPAILRAIFCDGAAFPRVDFLTNLLSFCVNVRNAGLHDHHLVTLLSSSVAGSLYGGAGHSLVYEEPQVYALAVRYLLEVSSPAQYPTTRTSTAMNSLENSKRAAASSVVGMPPLVLDVNEGAGDVHETTKRNSNPYTLPWSLRGLLEDDKVRQFFAEDIRKLVRDYEFWAPTTKTLKDVQFRLEPLRMVSSTSSNPQRTASGISGKPPSSSKL